jgi:DNA invertase Pin-like site-specific DNA recombinase
LDELKEGDILVACEISRLSRSLLEVMRILECSKLKKQVKSRLIHKTVQIRMSAPFLLSFSLT